MERDASPSPPVKESCCNYRMLPAAAYVNPEVKGFISADPGKTIWFMSFAFLVLAVLQVAYASAGTECMCLYRGLRDGVEGCGELPEHDDPEEVADRLADCKVYGFTPVALVTNTILTLGTLVGAVAMPVTGAIVDRSDCRWETGVGAVCVVAVTQAVMLFLNEGNWLFMAALIGASFPATYMTHELALRSYMPELVEDLVRDLPPVTGAAKKFQMVTLVFFFAWIGGTSAAGAGTVHIAMLTMVMSIVLGGVIMINTWSHMGRRKA